MSGLELHGVGRRYRDVVALDGLDLEVAPGEIVALTGPSGAGKTTTCRLISGVEDQDAGAIGLAGRSLEGVSPQARRVAYMFESYALYPQLPVADNVAFPLRAPTREPLDAATIAARVEEVLALVEMGHLGARMPAELSGGQKQRVALCRTLVQRPDAYLLDEPISHLDAKLRHKLRGAIRRRLTASGVPALWCTPDGLEALSVADRVAVLVAGRLEQVDTPERVFDRPASIRVARLLGDPPMNLLAGELVSEGGRPGFRCEGLQLTLPARLTAGAATQDVVLGIPPTSLGLDPAGGGVARVEVYAFEPFGKYAITTLDLGGQRLKAKSAAATAHRPGEVVALNVDADAVMLFDRGTGTALGGPGVQNGGSGR